MTIKSISKTRSEINLEKQICKRMKEMLSYDPSTGLFTWLVNGKTNAKYKPGDTAGRINYDGYVTISFMGQTFMASRLAWLYVHGEFPMNHVDHIDRNRKNNCIDNLRDVSGWMNSQNRSNLSTSGIIGVTIECFDKRWSASIIVNGVYHYLGGYKSLLSAAKARYRAEKRYKCLEDGLKSSAQIYVESLTQGGRNTK